MDNEPGENFEVAAVDPDSGDLRFVPETFASRDEALAHVTGVCPGALVVFYDHRHPGEWVQQARAQEPHPGMTQPWRQSFVTKVGRDNPLADAPRAARKETSAYLVAPAGLHEKFLARDEASQEQEVSQATRELAQASHRLAETRALRAKLFPGAAVAAPRYFPDSDQDTVTGATTLC